MITLGNDTEDNIKENNKIEKSKKEFSKTLPYMNYEQRQYSDEFWEQLIDNNKKWGNYLWKNMKNIKKKIMDI